VLLKLKQLFRNQQGSSIVLISLSMVGLLALTGLVVDMGSLYNTKAHLQKTANAAVLSGAQELTNGDSRVAMIVDETLSYHAEDSSLINLEIQSEQKVSIVLRNDIPLAFSRLIGIDSVPVEVYAAAEILPMGRAMGAAPLGIDESINLVFYQEYKLKVDQNDVDTGNFGVLALGGSGAKTYYENLVNGYSSEIKIGDVLETQTGNIADKTREGVKARIDSCPYPVEEIHHRDCARVILIPVYKPYNQTSNQLKEVEIVGFAYFYITEPMSSNDTSITGMFIKRAGTGFVDAGVVNKGAFGIRLTQ
jgi:hypothetical protein